MSLPEHLYTSCTACVCMRMHDQSKHLHNDSSLLHLHTACSTLLVQVSSLKHSISQPDEVNAQAAMPWFVLQNMQHIRHGVF